MTNSLWIVVFQQDGAEAPLMVGPFTSDDNAVRFAEKRNGTVYLLDPAEDYTV